MEERTNLQKTVLVVLAALIVVFGILTGVIRSHKGVLFEGTLLERTVAPGQTTYTGKVKDEAVTVTVNNDGGNVTTVAYDTGMVHDIYTLEYPLAPIQTEYGAVDGVRVWKNGIILFVGGYAPDQGFHSWYTASGQWDSGITVSVGGTATPTGDPGAPAELDKRDVMYFAKGPALTARGDWDLYALLVVLTLLLMVDVAWPTALFYIQHCCDVRDPEPSDLYIAIQHVGWVVYPILLLIGYGIALGEIP